MKNLIGVILILLSISLFSQEIEKPKMFSTFKLGILGGINFSTLSGGSVVVEEKTNLTSNLNLKLSVGYSTINKKEGYTVKSNALLNYDDYNKYITSSHKVDEINYDVIPFSLGLEYVFLNNNFSPYGLFEVGYNYYTFHFQTSHGVSGEGGTYDTYEEVPAEYKNKPPVIPDDFSYRIALGIGTNYKLTSAINLDVRYLYQFNKSIINTNQVLIGINF
jgi:opacity protein-like surface antigen